MKHFKRAKTRIPRPACATYRHRRVVESSSDEDSLFDRIKDTLEEANRLIKEADEEIIHEEQKADVNVIEQAEEKEINERNEDNDND